MEINREKLLRNLQGFALHGNGVVIGGPGVGKTYLLKKLCQNLNADGIPHLLLPIDQLGNGTDETLRQELSYDGDLIAKLKSVPVSDKKSILLFDAFDSTRNEQTRKRFLNLIRRAIFELNESWNVMVTVRTYDAKKSQELLDLFGSPYDADLPNYQSAEMLCRHFKIPWLNQAELQQAFVQIPYLESVYQSGSEDFKKILRNPFNLWLLEKILKTSQDVPHFSHIRSEVQLLGLFWQRRIEGENNGEHRRFVLEQIAHRMVEDNSLSVRQNDVYKDLGLEVPARQGAWDDLLSDEILAKISLTGQRIAFSHNILFDYAISVLLIEHEPKQLEYFIHDDPSRPIFLRPSLTYFFTRLWYDDIDNFWIAFWHVFLSNQSAQLRLVRLIPTSVIANEVRKIDQQSPLLEKLQNGEGVANETIMMLLQSLRALQIKRDALWSAFFDQVSVHLHHDFAWDLATFTSEMLVRSKPKDTTVMDACGRVGRRLLTWIWKEKKTSKDDWYNRLGGSWVVPLVAKTYGTNPEESRLLLEEVIDLTHEEDFPINLLIQLCKHVDKIWTHDPEFIAKAYRAVFAYNETSEEMTHLAGGPVFQVASTRRQDFSSCQYWLIQHLPNFLRAAPLSAAKAVIPRLNIFIVKTNIFSYQDGVPHEDLAETFNFRGKPAYFIQDYSREWDEREILDEPIQMADALFDFIAGLAASNESHLLLDSLLDVFRDDVRVAFFWKRLLKTASQFPDVFAPRLFELCIAKPIQESNDVLDNLRTFLETAACQFTLGQRRQIEESILELPRESGNNRLFLQHRRNQLLEKIPYNLLITQAAKKIRDEMERENDVPENPRSAGFESSNIQHSDDHLKELGTDPIIPKHQRLKPLIDSLNQFSSDWLNGKPTDDAVELILPRLRDTYAAINKATEMDEQVSDQLWYKLTDCAAILSRVVDNLKSPQFDFCRLVLLHGAMHKLPKPDSERDAQFSSSSYSPFPRHEAAKGLLRLSIRQSDSEILHAIEALARDPVPSVRMVTATGLFMVYFTAPEKFWHLVAQRAANEKNLVVQGHMCATLTRVVANGKVEEENTVGVMDQMLKSAPARTQKLNLPNSFVNLLMWLAIDRKNPWALKTIEQTFFGAPIRFAPSMKHAISWVMREFVVLKNLETDDGCETLQRAIKWLKQVIEVASETIEELCDTSTGVRNAETTKQLQDMYGVIDEVIMRLYYTTAAHEKGQPEGIDDKLLCRFYHQVKPLMEDVTTFALGENGIMFAPTAYRFMQLLACFISCNPKEVLHLAECVARSSEPSGYNFDSLAIEELVKFIEIVLADHRIEVRDRVGLNDLLNLLDIFVRAGWSDALSLVWRLDEIFR